MTRLSHVQKAVLALAAALAAEPALAHHVMGGAMPATFGQGLLSGLGHPIIGLDHLAALVGAGLVAARIPARARLAGRVRDRDGHRRRGPPRPVRRAV